MTTKRFTITGERSISDHQKKRLYDLSDFDGMISVTERLNELYEKDRDGEECYRKLLQKYDSLKEENEQLKHFIQELTTKGTGKIHLANGNIYKVNAILTDFKR